MLTVQVNSLMTGLVKKVKNSFRRAKGSVLCGMGKHSWTQWRTSSKGQKYRWCDCCLESQKIVPAKLTGDALEKWINKRIMAAAVMYLLLILSQIVFIPLAIHFNWSLYRIIPPFLLLLGHTIFLHKRWAETYLNMLKGQK